MRKYRLLGRIVRSGSLPLALTRGGDDHVSDSAAAAVGGRGLLPCFCSRPQPGDGLRGGSGHPLFPRAAGPLPGALRIPALSLLHHGEPLSSALAVRRRAPLIGPDGGPASCLRALL